MNDCKKSLSVKYHFRNLKTESSQTLIQTIQNSQARKKLPSVDRYRQKAKGNFFSLLQGDYLANCLCLKAPIKSHYL